MNRRTFLKSLLALPFAAKVALPTAAKPVTPVRDPFAYAGSNGILGMLHRGHLQQPDFMCGPEQAKALDKAFARFYVQSKRRAAVMSDDEWKDGRRTIRYKYLP